MDKQTAVLGNFSITLPGPNGSSLQISGYVYEGESKESLDARMDISREVLERQQSALEIPVLEERMVQLERQKGDVERAYADLLEKQKRKQLASAELPHLKNYPHMLKQLDEEMQKGKFKIASVKKTA
jgi:hypothetical protein